ncbi:EamA family transporter [Butyrivibrio sp. YAB3001]|uniref:EamA family transporter n=1 Tax=Butyrivibrio sp. YAB3001 TaxID=1520812 RepID=UPI0008F65967|nr:EamA family transporter [Butyrivibrio sp. YAB3001]SFC77756.1 EamA-like transporter family protein [Butyrivibrio sp. YAB3001]
MISIYFFMMIISEFVSASSQMLLKKSAGKEYRSFIREYLNGWVICGYGLLFLAMVISIFCYSGLGYMGVVVLEPINYILVMIMSRIFFKEKITKKKLLGVMLIICGIVIFYGARG